MSKKNHFLLGFILGGASALAATYLLTPQTTDELKKKLKSGTNELSDRAADYFDFAKDATEDFRTSAEEFVTGLKTKITPNEDGDISAFTNATAAIRTKLAGGSDDDDDFDDIVVDGKSAFGQAKDAGEDADADVDDVEPDAGVPTEEPAATAGDAEAADVAADTAATAPDEDKPAADAPDKADDHE